MIARPERGELRRVVELLRILVTGDDAVVIAADVELPRLPVAHGVEDLVGLRAVADEVAQADHAMDLLAPHAVDHRTQRLGVGVEVADDERSHPLLRASRPFGSSKTRRSTISAGVSSSRIAPVMSHIR